MQRLILALLTIVVASLGGCYERTRYQCQIPSQFTHPRCQRPVCEFNQNCPDYLVAPILQKNIPNATLEPGRN